MSPVAMVAVVVLWGCAAGRAAPAAGPTGVPPQASADGAPPRPDCPRGASDPAARLAEGEALIASAMVGEHAVGWNYAYGQQALREAADAGYPPALYAWGRVRYLDIYMDAAPREDDVASRQVMTWAIAYLATAARLGHAPAQRFFPESLTLALTADVPLRDDLALDDGAAAGMPWSWLEDGRKLAVHLRGCWQD